MPGSCLRQAVMGDVAHGTKWRSARPQCQKGKLQVRQRRGASFLWKSFAEEFSGRVKCKLIPRGYSRNLTCRTNGSDPARWAGAPFRGDVWGDVWLFSRFLTVP